MNPGAVNIGKGLNQQFQTFNSLNQRAKVMQKKSKVNSTLKNSALKIIPEALERSNFRQLRSAYPGALCGTWPVFDRQSCIFILTQFKSTIIQTALRNENPYAKSKHTGNQEAVCKKPLSVTGLLVKLQQAHTI